MDSRDLARYIDITGGASKPWLLIQLRLSKLKERRPTLSHAEYISALDEIQADLMQLGQWWVGQESSVFKAGNVSVNRANLDRPVEEPQPPDRDEP